MRSKRAIMEDLAYYQGIVYLLRQELQELINAEEVDDHNSVWGGAGPDCLLNPALIAG